MDLWVKGTKHPKTTNAKFNLKIRRYNHIGLQYQDFQNNNLIKKVLSSETVQMIILIIKTTKIGI